MKNTTRVHVAINVSDFEEGRKFYSELLGRTPNRMTHDQLDWIIDQPPIHLSIYSNPKYRIGVEHIGFDMGRVELKKYRDRIGIKNLSIDDPDGLKIEFYTSEPNQG